MCCTEIKSNESVRTLSFRSSSSQQRQLICVDSKHRKIVCMKHTYITYTFINNNVLTFMSRLRCFLCILYSKTTKRSVHTVEANVVLGAITKPRRYFVVSYTNTSILMVYIFCGRISHTFHAYFTHIYDVPMLITFFHHHFTPHSRSVWM